MALPKIASPQPAIFTSDPVEQIYAKGVLDPTSGGLAGMLLHAAKMGRSQDQDTYLGSLRDSNVMSERLARFESMQDMMKERMKQGAGLIKEGYTPSATAGGDSLFTNIEDADATARLIQDVIRSNAEKNRKAHMTGGGGTKDQFYVEGGTPGYMNAAGTDAAEAPAIVRARSADPAKAYQLYQQGLDEVKRRAVINNLRATPEDKAKRDADLVARRRNVQPD